MSQNERHALNKPLYRFTDNTIVDAEQIENELSRIKHEGVAVDNGEMDIHVRCIAATVRNFDRKMSLPLAFQVLTPAAITSERKNSNQWLKAKDGKLLELYDIRGNKLDFPFTSGVTNDKAI